MATTRPVFLAGAVTGLAENIDAGIPFRIMHTYALPMTPGPPRLRIGRRNHTTTSGRFVATVARQANQFGAQVNRYTGKGGAEREQELTYGHHDVVASLDEDAQDRWLTWAVEYEATVQELRDAIRAEKEQEEPGGNESDSGAGEETRPPPTGPPWRPRR